MSLALSLIALVVFFFRGKQGRSKQEEKTLWVIWFVHFIVVAALTIITRDDHSFDSRYVKPVDCLVWGAAIWALLRLRYGKYIVYAALGFLVVYNGIMFTKHLIPGSRRQANLIASNWAMELIKNDWQGPKDKGADKLFTIMEYTSGGSPAISPISKRMNYLLGARNADRDFGKKFGRPEYIVEEVKRLKFDPWDEADYALFAEKHIGKRHYLLYKRKHKH